MQLAGSVHSVHGTARRPVIPSWFRVTVSSWIKKNDLRQRTGWQWKILRLDPPPLQFDWADMVGPAWSQTWGRIRSACHRSGSLITPWANFIVIFISGLPFKKERKSLHCILFWFHFDMKNWIFCFQAIQLLSLIRWLRPFILVDYAYNCSFRACGCLTKRNYTHRKLKPLL